MNFPKDKGVGDWKSGKIFKMGKAPSLEKHFLNFLEENVHFSFMQQRLTFDHDLEWKKCFWKPNLEFTQEQESKK